MSTDGKVPMSVGTAERFILIWNRRADLLPKSAHGPTLPASWRTVYELTKLPDDTLAWAHEQGKI